MHRMEEKCPTRVLYGNDRTRRLRGRLSRIAEIHMFREESRSTAFRRKVRVLRQLFPLLRRYRFITVGSVSFPYCTACGSFSENSEPGAPMIPEHDTITGCRRAGGVLAAKQPGVLVSISQIPIRWVLTQRSGRYHSSARVPVSV